MGLSFSGVVVRYPGGERPVLDAISLAVADGERVAVMGANGSGKSTALGVWAGLVAPSRGTALIGEVDPVRSPSGAARLVGWATAEGSGFSARLSVYENLRFFAALYEVHDLDARIESLDGTIGISALLGQRFQTLSAGQRARVSLTRALLHRPKALLLDEVTRVFDPAVSNRVHGLLRELAAAGVSVVLVTHDRVEADRMDRVILLDGGGVRIDGPPSEVGDALDAAFAERA